MRGLCRPRAAPPDASVPCGPRFDHAVTITLGFVFLPAFIVCGVFVLASPERLGHRG
jgi:hypothetical protein